MVFILTKHLKVFLVLGFAPAILFVLILFNFVALKGGCYSAVISALSLRNVRSDRAFCR